MDILEETDIDIEFIQALSLNVESFLRDIEYRNISINFRQTVEEVSFPVFYGKIWTPPGYALQIRDMFIVAYNGFITSVDGKDYKIQRQSCSSYTRHRRAAYYNDDPYNYITSFNIRGNKVLIKISRDVILIDKDTLWVRKGAANYSMVKPSIISVDELSLFMHELPRYNLVKYTPKPNRCRYYRATSIEEIKDNYEEILENINLNKSFFFY